MSCTQPIPCWRPLAAAGAKPIFKQPHISHLNRYEAMHVPCNHCISCKTAYASQWGIRITHEAKMHKENCFLTLTYSDEHLPDLKKYPGGNLSPSDLQKFIKRLRKALPDKTIRFYACGEYGDKSKRAHYHLIIFGYNFPDKYFWRKGQKNDPCYRSDLLEKLWPFGQSEIGSVSNTSANYVAGYVTKKITGNSAEKHYNGRIPEFARMSSGSGAVGNRGIGYSWFDKYKSDIYSICPDTGHIRDEIIIDGKKRLPPPYYDRLMALENPELMLNIKEARIAKAKKREQPDAWRQQTIDKVRRLNQKQKGNL